jgi:hypothetical protein
VKAARPGGDGARTSGVMSSASSAASTASRTLSPRQPLSGAITVAITLSLVFARPHAATARLEPSGARTGPAASAMAARAA